MFALFGTPGRSLPPSADEIPTMTVSLMARLVFLATFWPRAAVTYIRTDSNDVRTPDGNNEFDRLILDRFAGVLAYRPTQSQRKWLRLIEPERYFMRIYSCFKRIKVAFLFTLHPRAAPLSAGCLPVLSKETRDRSTCPWTASRETSSELSAGNRWSPYQILRVVNLDVHVTLRRERLETMANENQMRGVRG